MKALAAAERPTSAWRALTADAPAILAVALAMAASARLELPADPVPITAQTLAVLLAGALAGSRRAALGVLTYLAAGAAGLPAFAAGGGPLYFFGPTGGYLVGFVPAAYVAGRLMERGWGRGALPTLAALVAADAVIFACGVAWLAVLLAADPVLGPAAAVPLGLVRFIPGEMLKIALAGLVIHGLKR